MTARSEKAPPLEKETVRLPDGRLLTFYRFPEEPKAAPPAGAPGGGPVPPKER